MLKRYNTSMKTTVKRATIYLSDELHKALKVKSAVTQYSVSELVNQAVKHDLMDDAEDLEAFEKRKNERSYNFEDVLKDLKKRGKI